MSTARATVVRDIPFAIDVVWRAIADFGNAGWIRSVERVVAIGRGVGMARRMHAPGRAPFDEVLEGLDAETHTLRYGVPHGIPLPVSDYHASIRLEALADGATRVHWSGGGTPVGVPAETIERGLEGSYARLIGWLEDALRAGA